MYMWGQHQHAASKTSRTGTAVSSFEQKKMQHVCMKPWQRRCVEDPFLFFISSFKSPPPVARHEHQIEISLRPGWAVSWNKDKKLPEELEDEEETSRPVRCQSFHDRVICRYQYLFDSLIHPLVCKCSTVSKVTSSLFLFCPTVWNPKILNLR